MVCKNRKRKGYLIEKKIVNILKKENISAKRVPLSGAGAGKKSKLKPGNFYAEFSGDIVIALKKIPRLRGEVKARNKGQGFKTLMNWLADNHMIFLHQNRKKPLVAMPMETLLLILKKVDRD